MQTIKSKTILFVTGAFVTNRGWQTWQEYFENKGYTTYAPAWPHKEGDPETLRNMQPNDKELADLTLSEVIDHYARFARSLPEKPIAIGHSLGGLITQILVNRDLVAAGVAIHSVPPQGVIPYEFSFLKSGGKALGYFTSIHKTYLMSFKDWQYAFVNGMPLEEQQRAYEENTIPESKRVVRGGLTSAAHVDFKKQHVPLLLTSGSTDHIIPASLNLRNFKRYAQSESVTAYKEFPDRNHFVLGLPVWQEDADYIYNWLSSN